MPALRAHEKGLEFICAVAPDVPAYLSGDPGRLRQVLLNLAGNALKFTEQGEISVRAGLVAETDTDVVVRFSVKDTGIGIPADKQGRRVPEVHPGGRLDHAPIRRHRSGLAISKRLVELMGGEIGLVSEEGRGSEFWFTVRLAKQAERARAPIPTAEIRGVHILVVDDNATNREVLAAQLKAWGVRPEEATDGPSALLALARARDAGDPFAAAILDMQMPDMDGADLARAIKADETLKHTRLVLMTSLGQRGDARQMEEIGFAAYLVKPARQSDLFDSLSTVLARSAVSPAEAAHRHASRGPRDAPGRGAHPAGRGQHHQPAGGPRHPEETGTARGRRGQRRRSHQVARDAPLRPRAHGRQMPEMDGFEATRRIRDPRSAVLNHGIPIIAMTAHAMQGDRERCLEAGMDDYVTKPISPQALAEALDRWLPREDAVRAPRDAGAGTAAAPRAQAADAAGVRPGGNDGSPDGRRGPRAHRGGWLPRGRPEADRGAQELPRRRRCLGRDPPGPHHQGRVGHRRRRGAAAVAQQMEKAATAGDLDDWRAPFFPTSSGRVRPTARRMRATETRPN